MNKEIRILVVDDNAIVRRAIIDLLTSFGFENVRSACDGKDALEQLHNQSAALVISDYNMKAMDGLRLLTAIKNDSALANIPFILMSGGSWNEVLRKKALELGAVAYMPKSEVATNERLLKVIELTLATN